RRVPQGDGKCEYDVYGTKTAGAVSITRSLNPTETTDLLSGRSAPTKLLSASQTRYLRQVAGFWPLPRDIRGLGPMEVQRYRTRSEVYDIDISRLPGDERYAEISRKVPRDDADEAMRILHDDLAKAGVATCSDQSSPAGSK